MKNGLDVTLRQQRLSVFGPNVIDIEGKSVISLLVDEVSVVLYVTLKLSTDLEIGHPPFLRLPDRQHYTVVIGRLLLLCILHCVDLIREHRHNSYRYEKGKTASTTGMICTLTHFPYIDHCSSARIVPFYVSCEHLY